MTKKLKLQDMIKFHPVPKKVKNSMVDKIRVDKSTCNVNKKK